MGAHEVVLQASDSERAPHEVPPWAAVVLVMRVRVFVPPPHAFVQSPHLPHSPCTQSTGAGVGEGVGGAVGAGVGLGV